MLPQKINTRDELQLLASWRSSQTEDDHGLDTIRAQPLETAAHARESPRDVTMYQSLFPNLILINLLGFVTLTI